MEGIFFSLAIVIGILLILLLYYKLESRPLLFLPLILLVPLLALMLILNQNYTKKLKKLIVYENNNTTEYVIGEEIDGQIIEEIIVNKDIILILEDKSRIVIPKTFRYRIIED